MAENRLGNWGLLHPTYRGPISLHLERSLGVRDRVLTLVFVLVGHPKQLGSTGHCSVCCVGYFLIGTSREKKRVLTNPNDKVQMEMPQSCHRLTHGIHGTGAFIYLYHPLDIQANTETEVSLMFEWYIYLGMFGHTFSVSVALDV